jgi:thymidylate synthase
MRSGRRILPLITCKKVLARAVYIELLWFLRAEPNISFLKQNKVSIWDANTTEEFITRRGLNIFPGETGPIYGCQWRNWGGKIDQLGAAIALLREDPNSRRIIVNAWNPSENPSMVLPPCHYSFQFVVIGGAVNIVVNMRSADMGLGVPFNIASYAFLTHMVALVVGMPAGEIVINMADCHVYETHMDGLREWLTAPPVGSPYLEFSPRVMEKAAAGELNIDHFHGEFGWEDITIRDYYPGPVIKLPMAI